MIIVRVAFCTASVTSLARSVALVPSSRGPKDCGDSRDVFEGHTAYGGGFVVCLSWLRKAEQREELFLLLGIHCR
jgi:hypothetical protein